jgi:hypothetical protein
MNRSPNSRVDSCGCCTGVTTSTPSNTANRPGLSELRYRVGTYASFLASMQARLSSRDYPALAGLKTRAPDDPSMALLDVWATVGDVLGFYNERLANEGYLRTAIHQRSVTELARLVGYQPRPGVASSVFLAYTLDANAKQDTVIPKGTRAQSIPGPGELPQSFETSDDLQARTAWNLLQPRMQRPYRITRANVLEISYLYLEGTALSLKADDHLLMVFGDEDGDRYIRRVQYAEPLLLEGRTRVLLQPLFNDVSAQAFKEQLKAGADQLLAAMPTAAGKKRAGEVLDQVERDIALGSWRNLKEFMAGVAVRANNQDLPPAAQAAFFSAFQADTGLAPVARTDIGSLTNRLLEPGRLQPRNALRQHRNVLTSFGFDADAVPQLLVKFAPRLNEHFYSAWASATLSDAQAELQAIYALRLTAPLFGYNAPARTGLVPNVNDSSTETNMQVAQVVTTLQNDWPLRNEFANSLSLDAQYDNLLPGGYALVEQPLSGSPLPQRLLTKVDSVSHQPRSDYQLSGKSSRLYLDRPWRTDTGFDRLDSLRPVVVRTHSELLQLAQEPINEDIGAPARAEQEPEVSYQQRLADSRDIELDQLHPGLQAGRWLIISGERSDIEATAGVIQSELAMLANVRQTFDAFLAGDKTLSTITLETPLAYRYKRGTVKIYGNVVKATHGETRSETMGSGNAAISMQSFTLKQPPLTYVSANTPAGAESTFEVYVNDLRWHETDSLAGQSPNARLFVTKTDDEAKTTVIFGNGKEGSRLPTGMENIKARYRNGIGKAGNVAAGQISLLAGRPLGVKEVINPLPATGGADRETRDQARANTPLALMALDRLVSVKDYEDFARLFAGIGKASARELSDGQRRLVHVTIAGADDIPIDETSDLFQNLYQALLLAGDPHQPLILAVRELMFVVISANIRLLPDYLWEPVVTRVRAALLDTFGFAKRQLGQALFLSEVIACIQAVPGVDYVDVDYLRGVPEKETAANGERQLITPERISDLLAGDDPVSNCPDQEEWSDPLSHLCVNLADVEEVVNASSLAGNRLIRPAQLAFLNPEVPATLILNPIN